MSRSHKKSPWCGDKKGKRKKRASWKTVRKYLKRHPEDMCCGGRYRKVYESWNICDYGFLRPWSHERKAVRNKSLNLYSEMEAYRRWYRYFKAK